MPDMILGPPEAPIINLTWLFLSTMIEGDIDEVGLLFGLMKLFSDAGISQIFVVLGVEKSSISLLNIILVEGDISPRISKIKFMVKKINYVSDFQ